MILAKLRNLDDYENISIQQLENIFPTLPTPKPFPKFVLRPNKFTPKKITPALMPKKSNT